MSREAPPPPPVLSPREQQVLLEVAAAAIRHGLEQGAAPPVDPAAHPARLREPGAAFVTLRRAGELRGCLGSGRPVRPLVEDVNRNAFAAAFLDPRFAPLSRGELEGLEVEVSVLGPLAPLPARSEAEVLAHLRPGRDGLVLEGAGHRGLFLPAVWRELPQPAEFLRRLKLKAGLRPGFWAPELRVYRFVTLSFARTLPGPS